MNVETPRIDSKVIHHSWGVAAGQNSAVGLGVRDIYFVVSFCVVNNMGADGCKIM